MEKADGKTPGYRGLVAWQRGMDLAVDVYHATIGFPPEERYGPTSQIRRAAVSVPANIAEGCGRGGKTELARFLQIAYGSLCELETHLDLSQRLSYLDAKTLDHLLIQTTEVARLIHGLIRSLKQPPMLLTTND